jgi:hypothetical protein
MSFEIEMGKKKVNIPKERIFQEPELTDNPMIFWIWESKLKPAFAIGKLDPPLIVMNLYSLKSMHDCDADIVGSALFLSAVLVEELTHCATFSLKNHKNWITWLKHLQEELHE